MKTRIFTAITVLMMMTTTSFSQNTTSSENYGGVLNLGLGIGGYSGYYGYAGRSLPVFTVNYEFDVARNFTLAPFISLYSYRHNDDHYRETIIPIGVKGSLYLDQILKAGSDWDFYLAGSLGFALRNSRWDDGYNGNTLYHDRSPLFLDLHLGTEYHISNNLGLFLDLSTGVSTIGLSFH